MVLPELKSSSLISLGQLCDNNCTVILTKTKLVVFKENAIVLQGFCNPSDGLWDIPLSPRLVHDYHHTAPVGKTTLQHNQVVYPAPHPALYPTRQRHSPAVFPPKCTVPKPAANLLSTVYGGLEGLVSDNEFNTILSQVQRQDRVQQLSPY